MKLPRVKNILISQPQPEGEKSPYYELAEKWKIDIDFRPFIHVEGVELREIRKHKINIPDFTAIIFNSRNSVDHFFRICEELRVNLSQNTKYFCVTESIALYLQKYIQYRKRKVFFSNGKTEDFFELLRKHRDNEKYLVPCSEPHKKDLPDFLDKHKFTYTLVPFYKTVYSDLSDLEELTYDVIIFFSPTGIKSLFHNFPNFLQNKTRIAAFGPATAQSVIEAGLRLDISAPAPETPSMTMALEKYLELCNK